MINKNQIRDIYKEKRENLSQDYIIKATQEINSQLEIFLLKYDGIIAGYYPIKNEIHILDCLNKLSKQGKNIALPWLDKQKNIMHFRSWKYDDKLDKSNNLLSPQPQDHHKIVMPSVIIVPLITCDLKGNRIGYGKGYYDKYLSKHQALLIGVCYEECLYPQKIPHENHDCKLDVVITEKQIVTSKT